MCVASSPGPPLTFQCCTLKGSAFLRVTLKSWEVGPGYEANVCVCVYGCDTMCVCVGVTLCVCVCVCVCL